jgi:HlyD family secretion protein
MNLRFLLIILAFTFSCKSKVEKTKPTLESISESIYASGLVKSKNQYQAFVTISGTIDHVYVDEGDTVKVGMPILSISSETQKLTNENAKLTAEYADFYANSGKLSEANLQRSVARDKMINDSLMYFRQKSLWKQGVGTKVELEQRELAYKSSKATYFSASVKYKGLKCWLDFTSTQAKKNLLISNDQKDDYTLRSELDGIVYSIIKSKGEVVNPQTALAVIGDAKHFILEMQVDEYDILKVQKGLPVLVTMDSYKEKVFDAKVTKIAPLMNERSKTFVVEAEFNNPPAILYPNTSFEANIVMRTKKNALLIPRNYLYKDSFILKGKHDTILVKTGLRDYKKVEILSGISASDEIIKPTE